MPHRIFSLAADQEANGQADKILIFCQDHVDRPAREIAQVPQQGARISVVRLLHPRWVLAGRLDGRITMWDLRKDRGGAVYDLVGHAGAIFSLDASMVRSLS